MHLLLTLDPDRAVRGQVLASEQPFQVGLNFHGVSVRLATNSRYLTEHVRLGYGYFEVPVVKSPCISLLALEAGEDGFDTSFDFLLPGRSNRNHVVMSLEGELIYLIRDRETMAYYTTMNLFGSVVALLRQKYACVHAATISRGERGVILCGAARCGKTSLTANLITQGFDYSSDDVTLLSRETLQVAPFPRAINVREECHEMTPVLLAGARRIGRFRIADQERLIVDLGRPVPGSVVVTGVCFPRFCPDESTELRPLEKAEAFTGLMQNRFHPMGERIDTEIAADFDSLGKLAERCVCYSLVFSDPVVASHIIAERMLG
jgi:hypothetical protein